jgi:uncharacterized protein YjiS (DUF1127 family)
VTVAVPGAIIMASVTLPTPARSATSSSSRLGFAWRWLMTAWRVDAERRALRDLDDHILADIGIDRCGVRAESDRPFWDLPPSAWARLRDGGRF